MGVATSIVVFAVGAIMRFATTVHSNTFNIQKVGDILMIVAVVGFVVSLFFWASWGGFGRPRTSRTVRRTGDGTVVDETDTRTF
jgi:hypothetical protein